MLQIMEYDGISENGNVDMYDWFISRLKCNVYLKLFEDILDNLKKGRNVFVKMDVLNQSKLLLEILKVFKCDSQYSNFEKLNDRKKVGIIRFNSKLSSFKTASLINQSVTGLFEVKVDLLK